LIVPPEFAVMSLVPLSVFEVANQAAGQVLYEIHLMSEQGGHVSSSFGMDVSTQRLGEKDSIPSLSAQHRESRQRPPLTLNFLRQATDKCRRIASSCAGVFTLAESGVLDGRRVTTQWSFSLELQQRFPNVKVERDRIFVADGPFWTSAGMTAGIDLALGFVERDAGAELAKHTAKELVVHHRRTGGQSQHSVMLDLDAKSDRVQETLTFARKHRREDLTVERLAEVARLSPRQFGRIFRIETGCSPARAIEKLRLEVARLMLEQGRLLVEEIASASGFGDRERMRRSFLRACEQTPQVLRNAQHPLVSF
jgi:transcriptional regulator GlxA family with amidase domain